MTTPERTVEQIVEEIKTKVDKEIEIIQCDPGDVVTGWIISKAELQSYIDYQLTPILTQTLQAERQKREEVVDALVELVAKAIYKQMECLDPRGKPEWVENGNSLKQVEARKLARQALTQPNNPK